MRSSGVSSIVGVEPDCVEGKAKRSIDRSN